MDKKHWREASSTSAKGALALCLAVWLGLLPVVQAVHLAFADHSHSFCMQHRQIEDVPRLGPTGDPEPRGETASLSSDAAAAELARPADLLLSFSLQDSLSRRLQAMGRCGDVPGGCTGWLAPDRVASWPHFRIAPKTSPPSTIS